MWGIPSNTSNIWNITPIFFCISYSIYYLQMLIPVLATHISISSTHIFILPFFACHISRTRLSVKTCKTTKLHLGQTSTKTCSLTTASHDEHTTQHLHSAECSLLFLISYSILECSFIFSPAASSWKISSGKCHLYSLGYKLIGSGREGSQDCPHRVAKSWNYQSLLEHQSSLASWKDDDLTGPDPSHSC